MKKFLEKRVNVWEARQIQGSLPHHHCGDINASYSVIYPFSIVSGECSDWDWTCRRHVPSGMKYVVSYGQMKWKIIVGFYWNVECRYANDEFPCTGSLIWC